jgi:hypothetical protein
VALILLGAAGYLLHAHSEAVASQSVERVGGVATCANCPSVPAPEEAKPTQVALAASVPTAEPEPAEDQAVAVALPDEESAAPDTAAVAAAEPASTPISAEQLPGLTVIAGEYTSDGATAVDPVKPAAPLDDVAAGLKAYADGDYRGARTLLAAHVDQPAASLAYVRAGFQLGEVDANDIDLLKKLADGKSGAAARMLGDVYRAGKFTAPDRDQAEHYYTVAIANGDKRSLLRLAQFYDEAHDARATAAYAAALTEFPDQEARYLYLVATTPGASAADKADAASRLDHLAATDLNAARMAFTLYRKNKIPGANLHVVLAAADTAFGLGAHELGTYLASSCEKCTVDEIQTYVRQSTSFDDTKRSARALSRLAMGGKSSDVVSVLDSLTADKAVAISQPLVKQLGAGSPAAVTLAQLRLQAAGLYAGAIDGLYGPGTRAAIQATALTSQTKSGGPGIMALVIAQPIDCKSRSTVNGQIVCAR